MMCNAIRRNKARFFLGLIILLFLVLVRAYESILFYDPFLDFFKGDYEVLPLPEFDCLRLFFGLLLRYTINSVLSLGLFYLIFLHLKIIKFTALLYSFFFIFLVSLFFIILHCYGAQSSWFLFYVRRFLIQPIFGLLFIPAFYYQKRTM
jgi:exosortase F-associated protein